MSNDLIASLKNQLAQIAGGVDEETRAVAGLTGPTSKRISIEGGVFRKYAGGKEVGAIEDRFMNVIVVKAAPTPSRSFYNQTYKKGVKISPVCWSNNTKTPDPEVKEPQSSSCEMCPHAVKGSGQNGMGMACRRSWRIAVALPNDPAGDVMQIVVPDKSIWGDEESGRWPWRAYSRMLANNNISLKRVITKMQFDTNSSAPRLLFSPSGVVREEDYPVIDNQNQSEAAVRAVKLSVYQREEGDNGAFPAAPAEPDATPEFDAALKAHLEPKVQAEPKLRETKRTEPSPDVAETLKKWAK